MTECFLGVVVDANPAREVDFFFSIRCGSSSSTPLVCVKLLKTGKCERR